MTFNDLTGPMSDQAARQLVIARDAGRWRVFEDASGAPIGIGRDGNYLVHLNPTERTRACILDVVAELNSKYSQAVAAGMMAD